MRRKPRPSRVVVTGGSTPNQKPKQLRLRLQLRFLVLMATIVLSLQHLPEGTDGFQQQQRFHNTIPIIAKTPSCLFRSNNNSVLSQQQQQQRRRRPASRTTSTAAGTYSTITTTMLGSSVTGGATIGLDWWSNPDVWVFLVGIFPFGWATVEFWRRIMFGESFGTGSDRVVIGMDDSPSDSRGARVLGKGALITAYAIFVVAFGTLALVGYSVVTSEPPTDEALAAASVVVGGVGGSAP